MQTQFSVLSKDGQQRICNLERTKNVSFFIVFIKWFSKILFIFRYEFEISDRDSANKGIVFFGNQLPLALSCVLDFLIKLHSQDLESVFIGDYAGGLKNYNGVYLP